MDKTLIAPSFEDPHFVGSSRFEWSQFRTQHPWRFCLAMLVAPSVAVVLHVNLSWLLLVQLFRISSGAEAPALAVMCSMIVFWSLAFAWFTVYSWRNNQREFLKPYGRRLTWEYAEAKAQLEASGFAPRPTFLRLLGRHWRWVIAWGVAITAMWLQLGPNSVVGYALWVSLWAAIAGTRFCQIDWDTRLSKFGAYLCDPPTQVEYQERIAQLAAKTQKSLFNGRFGAKKAEAARR